MSRLWPETPLIALTGENIDGENNVLVETGSDGYSWKNSGSIATAFTRGTVAATPLIKKVEGSSVVSFDGRDDLLTCVGSATPLGFIHTTGVFDIAVVFRRMATRSAVARFFGTEGKGLGVYLTTDSLTTVEGGYEFILNNGTIPISTLITQEQVAPIGEVSALFIRGDGTQLKVTRNFWDYEAQTFLGALGTGAAANDYAIGATGGISGPTPDNFSCVDIFDFLVWNRNLTVAELDLVRTNFAERGAYEP